MSWFKKQQDTTFSPTPAEQTMLAIDDYSEALDCAWCLSEQGIKPTSGSHGICGVHAALMMEAARNRVAQRSSKL